MKWYKKQMDKLKEAGVVLSESDKKTATKKSSGHSFNVRKTGAHKTAFPNPVAISKKNRPKTDSI